MEGRNGARQKSVLRALCHAASRLPEEPGLASEGHPSEAASPASRSARPGPSPGAGDTAGTLPPPAGCGGAERCHRGGAAPRLLPACCSLPGVLRGSVPPPAGTERLRGGRSVPSLSLVPPHCAILTCDFEADTSSSWGLPMTPSSGELGSSALLCVGLCLAKLSERAPVSQRSPCKENTGGRSPCPWITAVSQDTMRTLIECSRGAHVDDSLQHRAPSSILALRSAGEPALPGDIAARTASETRAPRGRRGLREASKGAACHGSWH